MAAQHDISWRFYTKKDAPPDALPTSIVVSGALLKDSENIRKQLKTLCPTIKFNNFLSGGAGWIFPLQYEKAVSEFVNIVKTKGDISASTVGEILLAFPAESVKR